MDIIVLRKGPEDLPRSLIVLLVSILLMLFAATAMLSVTTPDGGASFGMSFVVYLLVICFYGAVIYLFGRSERIIQALSAIIACGSLITLLFVLEYQLVKPLLGREAASLIGTLIIFWSVPVEGHIMARSIDQHWFMGIAIAMLAFIMQFAIQASLMAGA